MLNKNKMSSKLFAKCQSFDEFFQVLRADLEQLRGAAFKKWELRSCWVDVAKELLHFGLSTSRTPSDGPYGVSWFAIAEAEDLERVEYAPLRSRVDGYNIFIASTGYAEGEDEYLVNVRMELRHAPPLRQLVRSAVRLAVEREKLLIEDPITQSLKADIECARKKIILRTEELNQQFDKRHAKLFAKVKMIPPTVP
jgi:hypothetical protein